MTMMGSIMEGTQYDQRHQLLSSDLVPLSKYHMEFLKSLHVDGTTLTRPSHESLRRYSDLWLRLVYEEECSQQSPLLLIPPPDIAWLWHCHRLAPRNYVSYCQTKYNGYIVEANPPFAVQFPTSPTITAQTTTTPITTSTSCCCYQIVDSDQVSIVMEHTIALWKKRYPNEPFFLKKDSYYDDDDDDDHEDVSTNKNKTKGSHPSLDDGYDLISSTDRQRDFLWQVYRPHFGWNHHDDDDDDDDQLHFLQDGVRNYIKFLLLYKNMNNNQNTMKDSANTMIVPTYQIDLMWHTHILNHIQQYNIDCMELCGQLLDHDDSVTDRSEGGILDCGYQTTQALWKSLYHGEEYYIEGGMYRGEPPSMYYLPNFWEDGMTIMSLMLMAPGDHSTDDTDSWGRSIINEGDDTITTDVSSMPVRKNTTLDHNRHPSKCPQLGRRIIQGASSTTTNIGTTKTTATSTNNHPDTRTSTTSTAAAASTTTTNTTVGPNALLCNDDGAVDHNVVEQQPPPSSSSPPKAGRMTTTRTTVPTTAAAATTTTVTTVPKGVGPKWTDPNGQSIVGGHPGYIPPIPNKVNHPEKDYVYGIGSKGIGYYHITTVDCYKILHQRVHYRTTEIRKSIAMEQTCNSFMCGLPTKVGRQRSTYQTNQERILSELEEYENLFLLRSTAESPMGVIGVPVSAYTSIPVTTITSSSSYQTKYISTTDGKTWTYGPEFFTVAGGCGSGGRIEKRISTTGSGGLQFHGNRPYSSPTIAWLGYT
jgi:hypothetical protein